MLLLLWLLWLLLWLLWPVDVAEKVVQLSQHSLYLNAELQAPDFTQQARPVADMSRLEVFTHVVLQGFVPQSSFTSWPPEANPSGPPTAGQFLVNSWEGGRKNGSGLVQRQSWVCVCGGVGF